MSERSKYETHHGWAINVKDHSTYDPSLNPDDILPTSTLDVIYSECQEGFWNDARHTADEHGFSRIWSEGRMGGWAVVDPQPDDDDWERGDSDYAAFVARMESLEKDLQAIIEHWVDQYREDVRSLVTIEQREPAERAYWESRDVETDSYVPAVWELIG